MALMWSVLRNHEGNIMQKLAIALAAFAAIGFSGTAFAEEATSSKAAATATNPAPMSNSEMDRVVAGYNENNEGWHGGAIGYSGNQNGLGAYNKNPNGRFSVGP
jgi:expansin (peptidoglycan-binding protein)